MKVKAWGIEQAVWGSDYHSFYWFTSKEARDEYYMKHNYCDKLRYRTVDTEEYRVFESYEAWKRWHEEVYY